MANASSGNYSYNFTRVSSLEPQDVWYWIVKVIIAVLSIVGNGLVIYLIVSKRRLRAANNWFVLSLAIADLSIGLFTTLTGFLCTFHFRCDYRIQITSYNFLLFASTLNLWTMAIDRYIGIVHSLRYTSLMTTTRVITMNCQTVGRTTGPSQLQSRAKCLKLSQKDTTKFIRKSPWLGRFPVSTLL